MLWQDLVIGVGQVLYLVALIPSIRSDEKPAFWTSVLMASTLTVFAFTFYTLSLYLGVVTSASVAIGWWILVGQSWKKASTSSTPQVN